MAGERDSTEPELDPVDQDGAATVKDRVDALERAVLDVRLFNREGDRLAQNVERLGDNTRALTSVLVAVDEQAQALVRVDSRTRAVEGRVDTVEVDNQLDRRAAQRRSYRMAAMAAAFTVFVVTAGAWITDSHLQRCVLRGPNTAGEQRLCDVLFPGHDHRPEQSLQALVARVATDSREGCERNNRRSRIAIDRERLLAQAAETSPVEQRIHADSARSLELALVDCDQAYPIPIFDVD